MDLRDIRMVETPDKDWKLQIRTFSLPSRWTDVRMVPLEDAENPYHATVQEK